MKWILACLSLFLAVAVATDAGIAGSPRTTVLKNSPTALVSLHKAFGDGSSPQLIRVGYEGPCGGWITDEDGTCLACSMDQRPRCDQGTCSCGYDSYCAALCKDAGNCDERPTECDN